MSLTPQDKKFLLTLKDKGYSSDEAFKALQVAKTRKQVAVAAAKPKKTEFQERVGKLTEGVDTSNLKSLGGLATAAGQVSANANKYDLDPDKMGVGDYVKEAALAPVNLAAGAAKGVLGGMTKGVEGALDVVGAEGLAGKISAQREKYLTPTGIVQKAGAFIPEVSRDVKTGVLKSGGDLIAGAGELAMRGAGVLGMDSASRGADKLAEFREETFAPTNTAQKVGKVGGDIASYVIPGGAVLKAPKLMKGASTLQKLSNVGKLAAAEGAISGGVTAAREGELNSNVAMDAALGAAFPVVAKGVGATAKWLMKPKAAKDLIKESSRIDQAMAQAKNLGIDDRDIKFVMNDLTPANKGAAVEIFENAVQGTKNRQQINAFNLAGKYLDDYVNKAEQMLKDQGKILKKAREPLKTMPVNPRPIKQEVQNVMKNLGVKFSEKGVPDFELSEIAYGGEAKNLLNNILNFTKKNEVNAGDLRNLTKQINSMSGLLANSGIKKGDPAIDALTSAKSAINKVLENADKNFGAANKRFAQMIDLIESMKHGATVKLKKGGKKFSGRRALRRLSGNLGEEQEEALKAIAQFGDQFGLEVPLDFRQLALTADLAEKATGQVNPGSLAGVTKLGQRAREVPVLGGALKAKDFLKDIVSAFRSTQDATLRANLLDELAKATPAEVLDEATKAALAQLPAESIDKIAALSIGSLFGAGLSGVQESIGEDIKNPTGEPQ